MKSIFHRGYGHQNPSLLLGCNKSDSLLLWHLHWIDCDTQVRKVQKAPLIYSVKGVSIISSGNGLLCVEIDHFYKSTPSPALWNPATTVVRLVPRTGTDCYSDYCVTGFGFSPIINDNKIVRIHAKFNLVEVFSLSRGS